ncbi:MAG: hypothetical protein AAB927_04170, partial [Patescibacteria group bacterium]
MRPSQQRSSAHTQMGRSLLHSLARAFPTPPLLLPRAAGVDISDSSIKWLAFSERGGARQVQT